MSNWNLYNSAVLTPFGTTETNATATSVAGSGTPFTKGSFVQLAASTNRDWEAFYLIGDSFGQNRVTMDVAVGASGSEVVIANDLWTTGPQSMTWYVPLRVPSGSRVSARCNNSGAFQGMDMFISGIPSSPMRNYGGSRWQTNLDTASINGTAVDPGGTALAKGGWTTLISSSNFNAAWLGWTIFPNNNGGLTGTTTVQCQYLVDIGVGAAGSEQVVILDWHGEGQVASATQLHPIVWMPVDIPAGTRLAARAMCDQTNATDRVVSVLVYLAG